MKDSFINSLKYSPGCSSSLYTNNTYSNFFSQKISFSKSTHPLLGICERRRNQSEYIANHQADNDARSLPGEELVRRNYGGNYVFSAFPAFQRSNLAIFRGEAPSRKIDGQSTVFHAARLAQRNPFKYIS